ncbi:MAG: cytochrome c oxidase subunit II [Candidatus Eremiobacteraeota bacterium]|nr:cytochrome c oxidase subunit II [Candidatus Eremiobacteraeota bacterium]
MEWLTNPASVHGAAMRSDWLVFLGAGIFVGLYVYGCIFWCLIAYRASKRTAAQFEGNKPLEIFYVAIPLAIVFGLFAVTYIIEMPVDHVIAATPNRIAATAFRWSWRFVYPNGLTTSGTPASPPTLYLPAGETSEIDLRSADVTHSFWVPAFLFKRDAIPGMTNVFDITPTRAGRFLGRCAQFCGLDHALMTFTVAVVPRPTYERYLASGGATP